ncbi:MAG: class II aldolase/adducin family protein [Christensenellaceae bacterium]|jgi:L-fuculose-phosphate aldolase|nr:class II aldolase/adducin family protein [Christensenellaceae bacterium]
MTETELRQLVKDAGVKLVESNLVQGTWGNISVRIDDKYMLVTPSGLDYIRLTPEEMVVVNIETMEYSGNIKPTSEKKIHAAIYRNRKEIGAVIHSHPFYASSVAASRRNLPIISDAMEKHVLGDAIIADYGLPGTKKLTTAVLIALRERNACLMANHGIIACAKNLDDAFMTCKILEESSRIFIEKETCIYSKNTTYSFNDIITVFQNRKALKL